MTRFNYTEEDHTYKAGRNLAAILEVAAMDFRLKTMGHNSALEFSKRLFDKINDNK